MTTLDDTVAYVLANPLESVGHCALLDRMTEEHEDARVALLELVVKHPEHDGVRLAFAEWCERNGDDKRGAFVRASVAKAQIPTCLVTDGGGGAPVAHPDDCEYCAAKFQELLAYVPELSVNKWHRLPRSVRVTTGGIVRGFVECVTCGADDWLAHGDAIRREHPVTRVQLTTALSTAV
ncbi:unnamed protein product [Gemmata massiliana]|uniref:Uncharacterized protein n=1 Tax=Gemmata massiliana TaxID=1210884 RepID=A0A6P2DGK5_9BACT|nr:TIGR02996 domain-containing protein [Gemmata massiliana]VTR98826.1 unnamed protein product [Gemmata massiliana]